MRLKRNYKCSLRKYNELLNEYQFLRVIYAEDVIKEFNLDEAANNLFVYEIENNGRFWIDDNILIRRMKENEVPSDVQGP